MSDKSNLNEDQTATSTACALFDAFLRRRREKAEALIAEDFTFTSPYDNGIDRATYFERCWPNGDRFQDFKIECTAADDHGVFITYWCTTVDGNSFRNTEYIKVRGGQITSVDVYFGATYRDGKFVTQQDIELPD